MHALVSTPDLSTSKRSEFDKLLSEPLPAAEAVPAMTPISCARRDLLGCDVSTQRRAQLEQLIASCDVLPLACVVVDVNGKIAAANLAFARWLNVERTALCERALREVMPPFEAGRFAAHLEICFGIPDALTMETMLRVDRQRVIPVLFTSEVQTLGGEKFALIAISRREVVRRGRDGGRELEQDYAILAEALSHEVRAPLVTIRSFARILRDNCASAFGADERKMIDRIEQRARRLESILHELLAYVNLRREEPGLCRVEVEQLVLGVVAHWREVAAQRRAEIVVVRPIPAAIACPRLLTEALGNLLANALDFTSPKRPPQVTISGEKRNDSVLMNVADNGVGIEPQYHDRVFRLGERLRPHIDGPGAGFGLAIVRCAIERMNGRVWVESEPGRGSCFRILLPRA